jgi:rhodanese-related sulfurtransferase
VTAFVAESAGISAPKPPNLGRIVETNRGPFLGGLPVVQELAHAPSGAQLLDVRPVTAFLAGHARGALSVPVSGSSFSTKAGFVLDAERPVCILAGTHDEALRAAAGLRSVAFFELTGYVLGAGPETVEPVAVDDLDQAVAGGALVVDVREPDELELGAISGAVNVPYRLAASAELPHDRRLVTICETGPRAAIAASVLRARGYDARPVAFGGTAQWLERSRAQSPSG